MKKSILLKFNYGRLNKKVYINPSYITSIEENNSNWGKTEIEYIGNQGYTTTSIYVNLDIDEVYKIINN
jgi:hypothetical protein